MVNILNGLRIDGWDGETYLSVDLRVTETMALVSASWLTEIAAKVLMERVATLLGRFGLPRSQQWTTIERGSRDYSRNDEVTR